MKSRPKSNAGAAIAKKAGKLGQKITAAKRRAEAAQFRAQAAKADFKKARKAHKHARKLAKAARKKFKALKNALMPANYPVQNPVAARPKRSASKPARKPKPKSPRKIRPSRSTAAKPRPSLVAPASTETTAINTEVTAPMAVPGVAPIEEASSAPPAPPMTSDTA
jgi:type II secretory pathway pseudopilin PulG